MIEKVKIKNYKCFADFEVSLNKFNCIIGPNDTGKTTFLNSLYLWAKLEPLLNERALGEIEHNRGLGEKSYVALCKLSVTNNMTFSEKENSEISIFPNDIEEPVSIFSTSGKNKNGQFGWLNIEETFINHQELHKKWEKSIREIVPIELHRFDPESLKEPALVKGNETFEKDSQGKGLSAFLHEILISDRKLFFQMENEFYDFFPLYEQLHLEMQEGGYLLTFSTRYGEKYTASSISDGVMLGLAYLALAYRRDAPTILLIEEPETGVHPAALQKIVAILKRISENTKTQVIFTTHSPYLVDNLEPEEVIVFNRNEQGEVKAKRLVEYPDVEQMKKDFMTGEIWSILSEPQGI